MRTLVSVFIGIGSLAASMTCLWFILHGDMIAAAALHMAGGLLGLGAHALSAKTDTPPGPFEYTVAFCIPCFGGMCCWCYALASSLGSIQGIAEEYSHYIDADERMGNRMMMHAMHAFQPDPEQLTPMGDILRSTASLADKRRAIEALAQLESPEAVSILRDALSATSVEVRFFAASVIGRLEERLALRLKSLENDVEEHHDSPESHAALAQSYLDYAYFGLAEGARRELYLQRSLTHAKRSLDLSDAPVTNIITGRALLALQKPEEALAFFKRYAMARPDDLRGTLWQAEANFQLGRFADLTNNCALSLLNAKVPEPIKPALESWGGALDKTSSNLLSTG